MWRSRTAAFRRNLLQLFDSPTSPRRPRGSIAAAASSSVCPCPSRALNYYSSKALPFSEVRDSLRRASSDDPIFIKRKVKVQEDVVVVVGAESQDSDYYDLEAYGPDIGLLHLTWEPLDEDPAATMARFSLEVCSNQTLTGKTRTQAVQIIGGIAHEKPDSLEKYELVNPILQAMFPLLVLGNDMRRGQLLSPSASFVVKTMALNHPEQVFSPVLEFASLSSQNTNPKYRGAAVSALGDIAEVCSELMKDKLEPLLGIVLGAHRDADRRVREKASVALHQFVDRLRPEIVSQRQSVLPCILSALDENNEFIEGKSYDSLQALCDNMTGEEILPFLDPIMNKLLADLQGSRERQRRSFTAMCSVAAAADQHFVPYAERVLEVLTRTAKPFLETKHFVFAGALVTTVGRAGVEPILGPYIEAVVSAAAEWNCRFPGRGCSIRSYAYGFFCTAAETLSDGFAKHLPVVVPLAICSCNRDEDDDDSAADDDDPETRGFRIHRTGLLDENLDEKAAATRALGLFAVHTKSAFAPYLEESMSVMINLSAHYHEDVRLQGVIGLKNILTAAAAVSDSDGAAKAKQLLGTVMDHYIKAMDEDGDKSVVAQVCTNTAGILEDFGYAALEPYVPQIIDSALRLLQGQSACQRADDAEHEETLLAAVSNLLSAFARAAATSRFAPSICSMLSDAYIKLSAAPGSSWYRTTTAA